MIHILFSLANFFRRQAQRLLNTSTLGVKALIIKDNKEVMLVEHTYMAGWHLPGGGVGLRETPKEAIVREVKEETGLVVNQEPALFAVYAHQIMGAADYPLLYVITDFSTPLNVKLCKEIRQARWFDINNLPPETSESTLQRIKEVIHSLPIADTW
ncbi:MAG: NUDIX domain-containing protein [Proteobacteria bacterium]|nr:NUDIX domain-containing protein [Pseudomonadota bacterium]